MLQRRRGRNATRDFEVDYDEHSAVATGAEQQAAGVTAVMVSLRRGLKAMGPFRTAASLLRLNQRKGFDCPGCAWPEEHGGRKFAEFCENGAKAVAEEATKRVVTPDFFARHSMDDLHDRPEYWLSQQGRLTHPMVLRAGDDHYRPIGWDEAYRLIADHLRALDSPDEAVFYTSGRTSNEAAFLYQLMVRSFGTNNLPDCSNMCHESSGAALVDAIGIGKGSVTVEDVADGRPDRHRRTESGHQPSADAVGAGEGEGQRREDHRGQPAARGRPDPVQGSAEGARRRRPRHPDRRRVRADPARRRHGAVRRSGPAASRGRRPGSGHRRRPRLRRPRTARTSPTTRRALGRSTWTPCWRRRASTAPNSTGSQRCSPNPSARSRAGRWA